MGRRNQVQHLYGKPKKTYTISTRIDLEYLARFINFTEQVYGQTVVSISAAVRAVIYQFVDSQEKYGEDSTDEYLTSGGLEAAIRYLVAKGLMEPGHTTQGDRSVASAQARQYVHDEFMGKEIVNGVDITMFRDLPIEERNRSIRNVMAADSEKIKKLQEELMLEGEKIRKEREGLDFVLPNLVLQPKEEKINQEENLIEMQRKNSKVSGPEAIRMELKVRGWARNPDFPSEDYVNLTLQEQNWFDDEKLELKKSGLDE